MKTLFTCVGTTDPVRGYRDGPMLHILRQYRPDRVCIFMSGEIADINRRDSRFPITMDFIREHWGGYSPLVEYIYTDISDPSELDAVGEPITKKVLELSEECEGDILLNISSGTPQMKMVLAMLASDIRYRTVGIQVKNPEKASGSSERTNETAYSVLSELECNEDEETDSENRCIEPRLLHLQKQKMKEQIIALIDQRNYSAVYALKNSMPDSLKALVGHLDCRDRLMSEEAKKKAQNLRLPFPLYPKKAGRYSDYDEISEAYLVLLNRLHRKQYEEAVIRLNPLVVRLELRMLRIALNGMGLRPEDIISRPYSDRPWFYPDMLQAALPDVYDAVEKSFGTQLREGDVKMILCLKILEQLPGVPQDSLALIRRCDTLNDSCRNRLAHQLSSVTLEELEASCGIPLAQLFNELGRLIEKLYPECDSSLFSIYKRCGEYIKEKLV